MTPAERAEPLTREALREAMSWCDDDRALDAVLDLLAQDLEVQRTLCWDCNDDALSIYADRLRALRRQA